MRKPSVGVIFLTVFIDLVGFGIVLPMLPIYGQRFQASGFVIGLLMASYSLMQFIFSPIWGRLSDRIGRRPVLLLSTFVAALSYVVFAYGSVMQGSTALLLLLGSRLVAGICGANITVAQAYIADITPAEQRSKKMGLIGMAFGLGFILGPVIGGVSLRFFDHAGPGMAAAVLCAANFILALIILPESLQPGSRSQTQRARFEQWQHTMKHPQIGLLVIVFFLATFCFACYETTLGLLVLHNFQLNPERASDAKTITLLFAYGGLVGAMVQGGMIGRMVKRLGEPKVIALSLVIAAAGFAMLPFITGDSTFSFHLLLSRAGGSWWLLLLGVGVLAVGTNMVRPPLFGMVSFLTPASEQGATLGVTQSAGSLARIAGPVVAGVLYQNNVALPYLVAAGLCLVAGGVTWAYLVKSAQRTSATM